MKNKILLVIIFLFPARLLFAQNKTDFRTFNWGTTFYQIQSSETAKFIASDKDDMLEYNDLLGGYDCNVFYTFNENQKLIGGSYFFTKKYNDPQLYIQDYNIFKGLLTEKYNKPTSETESWTSNSTQQEKQNYGMAIADGSLILSAKWVTDRTIIQLILNSVNKQPSLHIHYTAKSLNELENLKQLQTAIPKL